MGVENRRSLRVKQFVPATISIKVEQGPLQNVTFQDDVLKWRNWIILIGAQNISIAEFYFGVAKLKNDTVLTDKEKEFIIRELFLDAISAGALSFSAKVNPKDFSFQLRRANRMKPHANADLIVEYAPKGAKKVTGVTHFNDYYLEKSSITQASHHIFSCFKGAIWDASRPVVRFNS